MQHDPRLTYQMENVQSTDKRPFEDDGFNHSEPGTKRQITDFSDGGYYNRDHATLNQAAESQNGNGDSRGRSSSLGFVCNAAPRLFFRERNGCNSQSVQLVITSIRGPYHAQLGKQTPRSSTSWLIPFARDLSVLPPISLDLRAATSTLNWQACTESILTNSMLRYYLVLLSGLSVRSGSRSKNSTRGWLQISPSAREFPPDMSYDPI